MNRDHVHKYKRVNLTKDPKKAPYLVYKCVLPGCTHYLEGRMAEGKLAICWRCNKEFLLEPKHVSPSIGLYKPHCDSCTKGSAKKKEVQKSLEDLLSALKLG